MSLTGHDPEAGARNLLLNCVGMKSGDRVLIVAEEPHETHYHPAAAECVARVASDLGGVVRSIAPAMPERAGEFPADLASAMNEVDHTVFLSRLADHARFMASPGACTKDHLLRPGRRPPRRALCDPAA